MSSKVSDDLSVPIAEQPRKRRSNTICGIDALRRRGHTCFRIVDVFADEANRPVCQSEMATANMVAAESTTVMLPGDKRIDSIIANSDRVQESVLGTEVVGDRCGHVRFRVAEHITCAVNATRSFCNLPGAFADDERVRRTVCNVPNAGCRVLKDKPRGVIAGETRC